jgi:mono/diheme cytochrome c family protein
VTREVYVALVCVAGALGAGAAGGPDATETEVVAEGKRLYIANGCYACHGLDARGNVGPDLTRTTKSDEDVFARIANGRAGTAMTPFKDKISAEDIRKIVVYLRSVAR